ncbi:hypothetical protein CPB86DRAFT_694910 [Serendipita vermifera]|nr:hypothetical protein CPB86DRAFT_694910 [Serendipita vermifera]
MTSQQNDWSKIRLSLEKPYKDNAGVPLKKLLDISNDEEFIYEQPKSTDEQLGTRLQRIFDERGNSIWEEYTTEWLEEAEDAQEPSEEDGDEEDEDENQEEQENVKKKPMNVDELAALRTEVVPTLISQVLIDINPFSRQALNELMISRDVLGVYLKTAMPTAAPEGITPELNSLPSQALASTTITKPGPISSIQAFNTQLAVGGKDEALRKSAAAFKTASVSMRRALASGERYWTDALKARNANWVLTTAPLPFGSMTRRSTDNNAMDIRILYGLENSPPEVRLPAMVWLNTEDGTGPIAQGARKPTRLIISIAAQEDDGSKRVSRSTFIPSNVSKEDEKVEDVLEDLQREAVDREIFKDLLGNVISLTTAPAWVREQTISVEISGTHTLSFEMVQENDLDPSPLPNSDPAVNAVCDAIYHALRLILLRVHLFGLGYRNAVLGKQNAPIRPLLLQGIVELFQYYLFVTKLEGHLNNLVDGLKRSGVDVYMRFNRLGETAEELIALLAHAPSPDGQKKKSLGGEVLLRIAQRQTLRFTLFAPSSLTAYLSQSICTIHSMAQFDELLRYEVNRAILQRVHDIGRERTMGSSRDSWYVDVVAATCFGTCNGTAM